MKKTEAQEANGTGGVRVDATVRRGPLCSFCWTTVEDAEVLLMGPSGDYICSRCVEDAVPQIARYRRANGWLRSEEPTHQDA